MNAVAVSLESGNNFVRLLIAAFYIVVLTLDQSYISYSRPDVAHNEIS